MSEVAARRFILDSMPGQQMSIDADLNMGLSIKRKHSAAERIWKRKLGFMERWTAQANL